jgi:hypothetical protein
MSSLGRQLTPYLDSSFKRREAIFSLPRAASVSAVSGRRALTAAISPASAMERVALRAMTESARGEPISASGLNGPAKLSASPRVGQTRFAVTTSSRSSPG